VAGRPELCSSVVGRVVGLLVESRAKMGSAFALGVRIEKAPKEDDWLWQVLILWPPHAKVLLGWDGLMGW
jgi:hypothetical protein